MATVRFCKPLFYFILGRFNFQLHLIEPERLTGVARGSHASKDFPKKYDITDP
jgi:hypothetical protein